METRFLDRGPLYSKYYKLAWLKREYQKFVDYITREGFFDKGE